MFAQCNAARDQKLHLQPQLRIAFRSVSMHGFFSLPVKLAKITRNFTTEVTRRDPEQMHDCMAPTLRLDRCGLGYRWVQGLNTIIRYGTRYGYHRRMPETPYGALQEAHKEPTHVQA